MGQFTIDLSDPEQTGGGHWLRGQRARHAEARRLMLKLDMTYSEALDQALLLVDAADQRHVSLLVCPLCGAIAVQAVGEHACPHEEDRAFSG